MKILCYCTFIIAVVFGSVGIHYATTPLEGYMYGMFTGAIGVASIRAALHLS